MANLEAYGEKIVGLTGSVVEWTQTQATGTKIAEIDIDGTTTDVYAPSGGGGGSLDYASTENVIGTWNGKPLYSRIYTLGTPKNLPSATWTTMTDVSADLIDKVINGYARTTGDIMFNPTLVRVNSGNLQMYNSITVQNIDTVYLHYTKTSDI